MSDPGRWTTAEFQRLRQIGDPRLDDAVADYYRDRRDLHDARALIRAVIQDLAAAKNAARSSRSSHSAVTASGEAEVDVTGPVSAILDRLGARSGVPSWGCDPEVVERGQAVFGDHGLYQVVALFCVSLPLSYAEPSTARLLAGVSDLATSHLTRRIAETGQMLIDVMGVSGGAASLRPGGAGHTTAIALRVLHSFVRTLVREHDLGPDRAADLGFAGRDVDDSAYGGNRAAGAGDMHGAPVNQELLLATLLTFSSVTWTAMDRMGVRLADPQQDAHLYIWSVVGYLMGIQACQDAPLTRADVAPLETHFAGMLQPSPEGVRLMAALLADMESSMYLGFRKVPRSLIHWLFRDWGQGMEAVPALLGVPAPAWWAAPLLATARTAQRRDWARDPLRPAVRWIGRRAARYLIIGFVDRYCDGPAPFHVPPDLARSWRIGQSDRAGRLRGQRRGTRHAVRARLARTAAPHRAGRAGWRYQAPRDPGPGLDLAASAGSSLPTPGESGDR